MTDEYKAYLKSKKWKAIRLTLFDKRGRKCENCGAENTTLQIHHLTYERIFKEEETDLQIVCIPCHEKIHGIVRSKSSKAKMRKPKTLGDFMARAERRIKRRYARGAYKSQKNYKKALNAAMRGADRAFSKYQAKSPNKRYNCKQVNKSK